MATLADDDTGTITADDADQKVDLKADDKADDKGGGTILDDKGDDDKGDDDKGGDDAVDWRADLAGDDAKLLGYLGRYGSKKAFVEAAKKDREAAARGLKPLGDDPSETELAAYRKTMGVPDKPEAYLENVSDGLVIGEDDKPILDKFAAAMLEANAPKGVSDAVIKWYYNHLEEQSAEASAVEAKARQETEDLLRSEDEWGKDYRRNVNAVTAYLDTLPPALKDTLLGGFDTNGVQLFNNPEVLKFFAGLALDKNPLHTVVTAGGGDVAAAVADEIASLKAMMGNRQGEYWKGPKAAAHQARYLELLAAQEKMAKD